MGILEASEVTCMLPVKDLARARQFYEDGWRCVPRASARTASSSTAWAARCWHCSPKAEGTKAEHTAISFRVADIAEAIAALKSRGVVFADYDFPDFKTVNHVCVLGSEKAAWFNDPEGNILCLHEDIA